MSSISCKEVHESEPLITIVFIDPRDFPCSALKSFQCFEGRVAFNEARIDGAADFVIWEGAMRHCVGQKYGVVVIWEGE